MPREPFIIHDILMSGFLSYMQVFEAEEPDEITAAFKVQAVAIQIIPDRPDDEEETVIEIDSIEVKACFEEVETTVTTTPAGITTTKITTTHFTTTSSSITTVSTTVGELMWRDLIDFSVLIF